MSATSPLLGRLAEAQDDMLAKRQAWRAAQDGADDLREEFLQSSRRYQKLLEEALGGFRGRPGTGDAS